MSASGVNLVGLRIGVPRAHFFEEVEPGVAAVVDAALQRLRDAGAVLVEDSLPVDALHLALAAVSGTVEAFELPRQIGGCGCAPHDSGAAIAHTTGEPAHARPQALSYWQPARAGGRRHTHTPLLQSAKHWVRRSRIWGLLLWWWW
jgi:Asp-tRNA(Asn)/Glu-tRNA(Gln) amidotransferase A subunit family amidase